MTWFDRLDELKANIEALRDAGKFPACFVSVMPGATTPDDLKRYRQRTPAVFISTPGLDGDSQQATATGTMPVMVDVYHEGSGPSDERNRAAAAICEQIHVLVMDPTAYHGAAGLMGRPTNFRAVNNAYFGGVDTNKITWWRVSWEQQKVNSVPLNPDALADLNEIAIYASGAEFGGDDHDPADDESTLVDLT